MMNKEGAKEQKNKEQRMMTDEGAYSKKRF